MSIIKINKNKKHKNTKNYPQYLYIDFRSGLPYILQKKNKKNHPHGWSFFIFCSSISYTYTITPP